MEKPYKYSIFCEKTRKVVKETNVEPSLRDLQTGIDGQTKLKQTKTCYIDNRYDAKLRLYNYVTYTKNGLEIPRYKPFAGNEIGKSIPILNF